MLALTLLSAALSTDAPRTASVWQHTYADGTSLKVTSVADGIVNVKTIPRGSPQDFTHVNLILNQPGTAPPLTVTTTEKGWQIATGSTLVDVSSAMALSNISRLDGTLLSAEVAPPVRVESSQCGQGRGGPVTGGRWNDCPSCCLRASRTLLPGEDVFGGGVQMYTGPALRGQTLFLRTNAVVQQHGWSHVVAPFFMSSRGYGFLANTHALSYFDIGYSHPGSKALPSNVVCDTSYEDPASGKSTAPLNLTCPADWIIQKITFADYGLSTGICGGFKKHKACSSDQVANLSRVCIGRQSCSISNQGGSFAGCDPCFGNNQKHLSVQVECAPKGPSPAPAPPPHPATPGVNMMHFADPVVDLFFFAGPSHRETLGQFTALTGRMHLPPKWALGLWSSEVRTERASEFAYKLQGYHPQEHSNQSEVLRIAARFRANDIPLTALTLEPPWQTGAYPCTYVWDEKMFWDPVGLVRDLEAFNASAAGPIKLTLWEHAYVRNDSTVAADTAAPPTPSPSPLFEPLIEQDLVADWLTWQGLTPDFTLNATRALYQTYHTKTFVKMGVAGFKLDECDGNPGDFDPGSGHIKKWFFPDNATFPSGLSGAQMHNIFGAKYAEVFHDMYKNQGLRTFLKARAMYVGSQAYPTTFYSDSYDYPNYLLAVINSGFGGWCWAPELRKAKNDDDFARRAQLMLFSALASMDGWNTGFEPFGADVSATNAAMFRALAKERARLLPFLYSAFYQQSVSGVPVARALVVDYPMDNNTWTIADEYLLGDGLLVAPAPEATSNTTAATARTIYFPAGDNWTWYWAHAHANADTFAASVNGASLPAVFIGGTDVSISVNQTTIPVFQRQGSIIPVEDGDILTLRVSAAACRDAATAESDVLVYDDDGATTRAQTHRERYRLRVSARFGCEEASVTGTLSATVLHEEQSEGEGEGEGEAGKFKSRASWRPKWTQLRWDMLSTSGHAWRTMYCTTSRPGSNKEPSSVLACDKIEGPSVSLQPKPASGCWWSPISAVRAVVATQLPTEPGWTTVCSPEIDV